MLGKGYLKTINDKKVGLIFINPIPPYLFETYITQKFRLG